MLPVESYLILLPVLLLAYFLIALCTRCRKKGNNAGSSNDGHSNGGHSNGGHVVTQVQLVNNRPQSVQVVQQRAASIGSSSESVTIPSLVQTEISYNKISVREPLARVLAERAALEHTYNEVEEERFSSFYEEIAGSTNSSVTYTKIGDVGVGAIAPAYSEVGAIAPAYSEVGAVYQDPGYEVIRHSDSETDPGYEVISKVPSSSKKAASRSQEEEEVEIADPGYEVVKPTPQPSSRPLVEVVTARPIEQLYSVIERRASDVSSEPGYERVLHVATSKPPAKLEPVYATVLKYEEGFSERL